MEKINREPSIPDIKNNIASDLVERYKNMRIHFDELVENYNIYIDNRDLNSFESVLNNLLVLLIHSEYIALDIADNCVEIIKSRLSKDANTQEPEIFKSQVDLVRNTIEDVQKCETNNILKKLQLHCNTYILTIGVLRTLISYTGVNTKEIIELFLHHDDASSFGSCILLKKKIILN